jgi:hypothetical protein
MLTQHQIIKKKVFKDKKLVDLGLRYLTTGSVLPNILKWGLNNLKSAYRIRFFLKSLLSESAKTFQSWMWAAGPSRAEWQCRAAGPHRVVKKMAIHGVALKKVAIHSVNWHFSALLHLARSFFH